MEGNGARERERKREREREKKKKDKKNIRNKKRDNKQEEREQASNTDSTERGKLEKKGARGGQGERQATTHPQNNDYNRIDRDFGTHLRTLALKTENFSRKISRFSKTRKWIY